MKSTFLCQKQQKNHKIIFSGHLCTTPFEANLWVRMWEIESERSAKLEFQMEYLLLREVWVPSFAVKEN